MQTSKNALNEKFELDIRNLVSIIITHNFFYEIHLLHNYTSYKQS